MLAADPGGAAAVEPEVLHDAVQPAVEARARQEPVPAGERPLARGLDEVVGLGVVAAERAREAPEARQQGDELLFHPTTFAGPYPRQRDRPATYSLHIFLNVAGLAQRRPSLSGHAGA